MFGKVGEVVGGAVGVGVGVGGVVGEGVGVGVGVGVGGVGGGGVGGSSLQQVADTKRRPTCRSLKYYCEIFIVPITFVQIFCYCFLSCKAKTSKCICSIINLLVLISQQGNPLRKCWTICYSLSIHIFLATCHWSHWCQRLTEK